MNSIIVSFLGWIGLSLVLVRCQDNYLYYPLTTGTSCTGSNEITIDGLFVEVQFDLRKTYKPDGWTKLKTNYYRFTLCGDLSNSTCSGDWCFEEVNNTNHNECIEALARWEENDNTTIEYGVYYNETRNSITNETGPDKPVALHIQIANHHEIHKTCPNQESWINYDIHCSKSTNTTQFLSLKENITACIWNVSLSSPYGCVETINLGTTTTYSPIIINTPGDSKKLSTGSVFVIIFVVLLLTYLILGCAYNSFYHGRVGVDAVPNKSGWAQLWRYFKAGCETTYDTLCCHQGNVDYQNL